MRSNPESSIPSIKVLLIEDNPGDARLIQEALSDTEQVHFEVKWVDKLDSGIEWVTKDVFDVVLLDLSLPDSHGIETIISLREQAPIVPIVVLTGLDDEQVAMNAVKRGAQDYLIKGQVNPTLIMRSMRYAIERHRLQDELYNLSIIDELTGLYNRRGFFNQTEQLLHTFGEDNKGFYIIVADLDGMKQINDSFGHHIGDLALIDTANMLKETFLNSSIIARMGGDEFIVIIPQKKEEYVDHMIIEQELNTKMKTRLTSFNLSAGRVFYLSISLGASYYNPDDQVTLSELIIQADQRMYTHKKEKMR
ncbi:GGDEF domain-containing response regulator [Paenibacillus psychroresistens]|uniref:GGDEF domain-containing response regulator n=1 Tax=Paenibacillus psychroresistens TaxID=1778678 RepID=A0A6B8RUR9_9BACL|nr:GGDEF domain-containing response regulator [Paenibacillus psychroresistens]QGQ99494.1 GGDEF domain-containing response regulator [Paenibacillus psychroresistens]